jgi:hypothetical protein
MILDAQKYNHSTQEVHTLNIGRTGKSRKSKCRKNQIIPSPPRKFKQLMMRSTTIDKRSTSTYYRNCKKIDKIQLKKK